MQYKNITTSGTFLLKFGAGYIQGINVVAPGTTWRLQLFDGNDTGTPTGGFLGTAGSNMTVPAAGTFLNLNHHFSNGLIVVTTGATPGEIAITFY